MQHHFNVEEAEKYGIEKAILLNNLRFWIEKSKANGTHVHTHTDGKDYHWTFNSRVAFGKLFPYMKAQSIARWLLELEKEGVIISGNFNENKYDKTKWYSLPFYQSIAQNEQWTAQNEQPIPYNKPDNKHNTCDLEKNLKEVESYWNSLDKPTDRAEANGYKNTTAKKLLSRCRKITPEVEEAFNKIIKKGYQVEEINDAIKKYAIDILNRNPNNDFATHRFSFYEFLKQQNGFYKFINK